MNYFDFHHGPLVEKDEVLICSESNVDLYDGNEKTQWKKGKLSLSTHSLIYQALDKDNTVLKLSLENCRRSGETPALAKKSLFSSEKLVVPLPGNNHIKIGFKNGASEFCDEMKAALKKEAWKKAKTPEASPKKVTSSSNNQNTGTAATAAKPSLTPEEIRKQEEEEQYKVDTHYTADRIGIAGVMQNSTESTKLKGTFKDIDDVMEQASSLVANIKHLKQKASGNSQQDANDFAALESIEETLGLGAMVKARGGGRSKIATKQSKYYVELATELHAWMTHPNNKKSFGSMPIIPLIELFAVYNRARSGDLVSPDDVHMACKEMSEMRTSVYTLQTLSSGRMALVHKDKSIILHRLTTLLGPQLINRDAKPSPKKEMQPTLPVPTTSQFPKTSAQLKSVNDVQVGELIGVSSSVANDLLEGLEKDGFLCRSDAGFGCATFYWNIFVF